MNVFDYFFEYTKDLDKDFVAGNREKITFRDLYNNSLKLASFLKEKGSGEKIFLIGRNSVFYITAYLGIIKSGNICVPLDFSIEQQNLDFIAGLTESSWIFCDDKTRKRLDLNRFKNVIVESDLGAILNRQTITSFNEGFDKEQLAEIIFTSGSTGKPKGVMLSHKNLIANTTSIIEYLQLTENDRMLVVLPFYYCYGLSLLHTHLRVGGQIVLNNTFMFIGTVVSDLQKFECTGFAGVPSHFQMLLKKSTSFKKTNFPALRYVTQAGGKLHNIFIEEFTKYFPGIDFVVMYGQTEATARLSYLPPNFLPEKTGSIGKGIPGIQLKIVDKEDQEVKIGEVGEIIAKGDNIMKGYFKDEPGTALTLKNGWLHTGDLARYDEDGFIYIVAREKEIIKVGGKRVSPKEIEEVILSVPEVVDCTIKAMDDPVLGESLKAEVVLNSLKERGCIHKKIIKQCKKKLTLYKIPQSFQYTSVLKFKSSGKK